MQLSSAPRWSSLEHRTTLRALLGALLAAEDTAEARARAEEQREPDPTRRATLGSIAQHARSTRVTLGEVAFLHLGEVAPPSRCIGDLGGSGASGLLPGLQRGLELMRCLLEVAQLAGDPQLLGTCESWLEWRTCLLRALSEPSN